MGIGDLFYKNKVEGAVKNINNKSQLIYEAMQEYYKRPDFPQKIKWADSDIIPYIKGDLLKSYILLSDNKSPDSKTFFKDAWFYQNALNSVHKIYELVRQIDTVNKRHPEIAEGAQETLNDIYDFSLLFNTNQRKR